MDREELQALAARCEAASGPDRELDVAVALAVDWRHPAMMAPLRASASWQGDNAITNLAVEAERADSVLKYLLRYTASLDAALSLVPEGRDWMVDNFDGVPPRRCSASVFNEAGQPYADYEATAATPALALTAASLRARAAQCS